MSRRRAVTQRSFVCVAVGLRRISVLLLRHLLRRWIRRRWLRARIGVVGRRRSRARVTADSHDADHRSVMNLLIFTDLKCKLLIFLI